MNKKLLSFVVYYLLLGLIVTSLNLFSLKYKVLASEDWSDSFNCYRGASYYHENVRNWTNQITGYFQDVFLNLQFVNNISDIVSYMIYGNDTVFIQVSNGTIIKNNCTYYNLNYSQTIVFNLQFKPSENAERMNVTVQLTVYKVIIGDINRDDIVNIYDGIELGNSWHNTVTKGDKKDLNSDGIINIFDGILLGTHYGETL